MIFLALLVLVLQLIGLHGVIQHSGLYEVNGTKKANDFAAAWLVSKQRLISSEKTIKAAIGMASVTLNVIRFKCNNCMTLVTRDYFDYMVEHLSSATNQIPDANPLIFQNANERLQNYSRILKNTELRFENDSRLDKTLGVLIYSSNCFSKTEVQIQKTIRPSFFEVTFWATYRYFRNIAVYTATQQDADTVREMGLPFESLTIIPVKSDEKNRTIFLPRDSIMHVLERLRSGPASSAKYEYVYYSEGDQILHMRQPEALFDAMDASGGDFIFTPHRFQVRLLVLLLKLVPGDCFCLLACLL